MFNNFIQQLRTVWFDLSTAARIGLVFTILVCIGVVIGVGYWSAQPHYVPLVNNLDPAKASEIVSILDSQSIANKLNYSGSAVLVDKSKWNKAKVAIGDIVEPSQMEMGDFGSPFSDPATAQYKMRMLLEQRLAKTIMQISSVENAVVHLGIADDEPFIRDRKPTKASILVTLKSGTTFTSNHAQSIVAIVSSSVQGLQPQDVTVVDSKGNVLSGDGSTVGSQVANQLDYRRTLEQELAQKAESMLTAMLGFGRAVVKVSADVDFNQVTREQRLFDTDKKAKAREQIETTTSTQERPALLGPGVGIDANLGGASSSTSTKNVLSKTEKSEVEYDNGWINETRTDLPGTIKRRTVAAVVQLSSPTGANGDTPAGSSDAKATAVTKELVEKIIKQAVGFDETRNDQIEVLETNLAVQSELATLLTPPVESTEFISNLLRNISLGVAAIVAFVLGFLVIRRIQPVSVTSQTPTEWTPKRARQISDLASVIRENPELLSKVISAWAGDKPLGSDKEGNRTERRRSA